MSYICRVISSGQDTLFGKKIISTIGYNEQEIIRDILFLHANGKPIDCDPTYSIGNFYKNGVPKPKYKFDKFPQLPDAPCFGLSISYNSFVIMNEAIILSTVSSTIFLFSFSFSNFNLPFLIFVHSK